MRRAPPPCGRSSLVHGLNSYLLPNDTVPLCICAQGQQENRSIIVPGFEHLVSAMLVRPPSTATYADRLPWGQKAASLAWSISTSGGVAQMLGETSEPEQAEPDEQD